MNACLLLDADWRPLSFVSIKRALKLLCLNKAEAAQLDGNSWNIRFAGANHSFEIPAVLVLKIQARGRGPIVPLSYKKYVIKRRDDSKCQYCGGLFSNDFTIDHVIPRSKGGKNSWNNCVAACKKCNQTKKNLTLEEAKMRLLKQPRAPNIKHHFENSNWHFLWTGILGYLMLNR